MNATPIATPPPPAPPPRRWRPRLAHLPDHVIESAAAGELRPEDLAAGRLVSLATAYRWQQCLREATPAEIAAEIDALRARADALARLLDSRPRRRTPCA